MVELVVSVLPRDCYTGYIAPIAHYFVSARKLNQEIKASYFMVVWFTVHSYSEKVNVIVGSRQSVNCLTVNCNPSTDKP